MPKEKGLFHLAEKPNLLDSKCEAVLAAPKAPPGPRQKASRGKPKLGCGHKKGNPKRGCPIGKWKHGHSNLRSISW